MVEKFTLACLRQAKYMDMVTSSNVIQAGNMPPTERVTHHTLRVHLQIAQWKNLSLTCLDPKELGWKEKNGVMEPLKTDIEPAPAWLLQLIRCNGKTDSWYPCATLFFFISIKLIIILKPRCLKK